MYIPVSVQLNMPAPFTKQIQHFVIDTDCPILQVVRLYCMYMCRVMEVLDYEGLTVNKCTYVVYFRQHL